MVLSELIKDEAELNILIQIINDQSKEARVRSQRTRSQHESQYAQHRDRTAHRAKLISKAGREIGPIPEVVNPERKVACRHNLKLYYETYHARSFPIAWSPDHLRIIAKLQTAILVGGLQAYAMPRGSGKTTLAQRGSMWSANYGHHLYQMLLLANGDKAGESLITLQMEYETNVLLAEDFPEICYPIHCLERIAQRAKGQMYQGEPTHINWAGDKIVLPCIPGSAAGGAVLCVAGLQEAVRGAVYFHPQLLKPIRPSNVIVDDPQTRLSAKSEEECITRVKIITSDVIGMAGPGEDISVLVPCTVIEPGDAAHRLLDNEAYPEFRGELCKLLYEFPANMELWEEYDSIRRLCLKRANDEEPESAKELYRECNEFYKNNRKKMDAGADPAWPERHKKHEVSALQHAMNLFFQNPLMFYTEYQNDPLAALQDETDRISAEEIALKLTGYKRFEIPEGCQYVTGFIDVHKRILYYVLIAWQPDYTGFIIDYGTWPKPIHAHFTERTARPTMEEVVKKSKPNANSDAALFHGLGMLTDQLMTLPLKRVDGAIMPIDLLPIDGRYKTHTVRRFCASVASKYGGRVIPCFGRKIGADQTPLSRCKPRQGEHIGLEWTIPPVSGELIREVQHDTWFWKTFFHSRLATPFGDTGSLGLFGELSHGRPSVDHSLFARHLDSQYSQEVTIKRTVNQWLLRPGETQDHWFDTSVGATMAASMKGAEILGVLRPGKAKKRGRKWTELE